jgi:hypothetical protein
VAGFEPKLILMLPVTANCWLPVVASMTVPELLVVVTA